ncbi:hypothetical protein CABS03_00847 [Colletotrichum abscissum]|uniref:Uncharacterized protein n=1 Tax=Colletotrichum abscissum TaxID=1671311 RepID=A0A9Q0B7G6_9PEZI|nr:hypothetical protein CABS02_03427 [Colletotrichum abscissum]
MMLVPSDEILSHIPGIRKATHRLYFGRIDRRTKVNSDIGRHTGAERPYGQRSRGSKSRWLGKQHPGNLSNASR